jgi:membrane protein implicated in regulation of membrane protease activity
MKSLERIILAAGFILAFAAGLSLLFCVVLVGSAVSKGYSVLQFVGYWPLLTIFLLLLSGCFILGAEPLAKAIGKKRSDEHKSG